MAANVRKIRVTNYMKNVGRSVGIAVVDAAKDYNPVIANIISGSKESFREAKDAIKNIGNTELFRNTQDLVTGGASNLLNDIKTGNLSTDHSMDGMFGDMDFDFDDNFEDWGDDEDQKSSSTSAVEEMSASASVAMKSTLVAHKDSISMTTSITTATAKSANHIAKTTLLTSQAMYQLTQTGFQETIGSISNLNNTVVNLSKLAEPINVHIQNSSVFFSKMSEAIPDMQKTLHQIEENTRPKSPQKKATNGKRYKYSDIFDFEGNFDFSAWQDMVKGKGKDSIGLLLGMASLATGMGGGKSTSAGKDITKTIIDQLIPKMAKESMKAFNESLNGAISSAMVRGRRYAKANSNSILGQILNIITPDIGMTKEISTSRYEKGPVAWDGKSRKALMEVIPTLLGDIYTAVSGQEARVFDYETGKFTTRSTLKRLQAYNVAQEAAKAGGNFRNDMLEFAEKSNYTPAQKAQIKREIETYFIKVFENPDIDPFVELQTMEKAAKNYGLGKESASMMKAMLNKYSRTLEKTRKGGGRTANTAYKFQNDLIRSQQAYSAKMDQASLNGDSVLNSLYNGSSVFSQDEYNKTQMFYLQGIYEYTAFMAMNLPYMRGKAKNLKYKSNILNTNKDHFSAMEEAVKNDKEVTPYDFIEGASDDLKYYGKSADEIDAIKAQKEAEEQQKQMTESLNNMVASATSGSGKGKLSSAIKTIGKGIGKIKSWYEAPFAAMTNFFDTMTLSMNRFFFGAPGQEGLIDSIGNFFKKISDNKKGGKGIFGSVFDAIFGGKSLKESMSETWGGIKDWFSGKAKAKLMGAEGLAANNEYEDILNALSAFNETAARGRKVTRSGLVSVSEGELIIPSEFNPYYHGSNNKRRQLSREIANMKKFYGFAANGSDGIGETKEYAKSKVDDIIKLVQAVGKGAKELGNIVVDTAADGSTRFYRYEENKHGQLKKVRISAQEALKSMKDKGYQKMNAAKDRFSNAMRGEGKIDGVIPFLGNSIGTLTDGFQKVFNSIFGSDKELNDQKSRISDVASKALDSLGESKGAAAIGALGGAGLSLLTGVINPLAGAAIGGAIGITVKSQAVQDALFGKMDENGNRDYEKGALPAAIGKFMDKQLGDIGIGAGLGTVAGTFMGSPVLGAVVGSAIGFAKSSDAVKNALFGEMQYDKDGKPIGRLDGGLISLEAQQKIKDNLGAIGAGAIVGAGIGAATPIGLVGGIALGGVGGLVATSDKFKTWMFGDGENDKGFTGMLKDKVFKNIEDIGLNIMSGIKGHGKRLFNAITRKATLTIQKIGAFINNRLFHNPNTLLGRLAGGALNLAKKPFSLAGNILEKGKNFTTNYNLKRGFDVYQGGKKLTAEERLALGGDQYAGSRYGSLDAALARMGSKEEVETFQSALEAIKNPKAANKYSQNAIKLVFSKLRISGKEKSQLAKLIISGQYDQAKSFAGEIDTTGKLGVLAAVDEAIKINDGNKDRRKYKDTIKANLKKAYNIDIDKHFNPNSGNLISAIDRTKSEAGRFDKDEAQQAAENNENIEEIRSIVSKIKEEGIPVWNNRKGKKPKKNGEAAEGETEAGGQTYDQLGGGFIKTKDDGDGGVEPDPADTATKEVLKRRSSMFGALSGLGALGAGFKSFSSKIFGFFGEMKNKLFGDGDSEKKKGFFGKLLDMFTGGEGSILTSLSSFLSGLPGAGIVKGLLKGMSFGTVLANALGITAIGAAITRKLDKIASKIPGFGKEESQDIVTDEDGNELTQDEDGNYRDKDGNIISKIHVRRGDQDTLSKRLRKTLGRQLITGNKTWLGAALGRNKLARNAASMIRGSNVGKIGSTMGKIGKASVTAEKMMAKGGAGAVAKGKDYWMKVATKTLTTELDDACLNIGKTLKATKLGRVMSSDKIDDMCKSLSKVLGKAAERLGPKAAQASASLAKAVPFINIAFFIYDFVTGYEDARTTLGITTDPTFGQRLLAGTLRLVKNLIPIVGPLIPDSLVVDVVVDYIAPALGLSPSELKNARAAGEAEAKAAGFDSVAEYNKQVLGDYTFGERIGNSVKSTVGGIKQDFAAMKEKGIGGFAKDKASAMKDKFMEAFTSNNGGVAGILNGLGAGMAELLPGVVGEILQKNMQIKALASKGELAAMWKVSLSDFSKGGNDKSVEPSIFSKIVGQLPLIITKLMSTPMALMAKVMKPLSDINDAIVNKVVGAFSLYNQELQRGEEIFKDPDAKFTDIFDLSDIDNDPENPLGKPMKFMLLQARIASIPMTLFKTAFRHIGEFFDGVGITIKEDYSKFKSYKDELSSETEGVKDVLLTEQPKYESPLGGAFAVMGGFTGAFYLVRNVGKSVFGSMKDAANGMIMKFKEDYDQLQTIIKGYKDSHDLKETVTKLTEKVTFSSPISGIFRTISMVSGVAHMIGQMFKWALDETPLGGVVDWLKEKLGMAKSWAKEKVNNGVGKGLKEYVGSGSGVPFVSQYDPRYSGTYMSGSNVADKGCGPAVAVMASNGRLSMSQAIARSKRYQNGGGVSADYFADVLGGNVRYISGAGSTGGRVMNTLARGGKAILLGRNPGNASKMYSPFGPNNHYVLATGLDRNGNVIVNDPESGGPRAYNPAILGSVGMSVLSGGDSGMAGVPTDVQSKMQAHADSAPKGENDTDIARNVYGFLTGKGYSPEATAGIMGNLYAESSMDPTKKQGNGGPAAGIAQWESWQNPANTRFGALSNLAASRGKDWTDLGTQLDYLSQELESKDIANRMMGLTRPDVLAAAGATPMSFEEFKNSKDINATTRVFEGAFERAGKPAMEKRLNAAKNYFEMYSGSQYTGNFDPAVGATTAGAQTTGTSPSVASTGGVGSTSTGSTGTSATGGLGILGTITNAFSKIGSIFTGGNQSSDSTGSTGATGATTAGAQTTGTASSVGGYGQLDATSPKGMGTAQSFIDIARSQVGTVEEGDNITKYGKFMGTDGQAWCAAFVSWVMDQTFNGDKQKAETALRGPMSSAVSGLWNNFKNAGAMTNDPQPGDIIIYKGGTASHTGIVSAVNGNGTITTIEGNTSGKGYDRNDGMVCEKEVNINNNSRLTGFGRPDWDAVAPKEIDTSGMSATAIEAMKRGGANVSAAGSGIGSGSRWILNSNFGRKRRPQTVSVQTSRRFTGGDSGVYDELGGILNNTSDMMYNRAMSGDLSAEDMAKGQEAMIAILKVIAQNTGFINDIFQFIKTVLAGGGSEQKTTKPVKPKGSGQKHMGGGSTGEVDASLRAAVMTLAAIAKG